MIHSTKSHIARARVTVLFTDDVRHEYRKRWNTDHDLDPKNWQEPPGDLRSDLRTSASDILLLLLLSTQATRGDSSSWYHTIHLTRVTTSLSWPSWAGKNITATFHDATVLLPHPLSVRSRQVSFTSNPSVQITRLPDWDGCLGILGKARLLIHSNAVFRHVISAYLRISTEASLRPIRLSLRRHTPTAHSILKLLRTWHSSFNSSASFTTIVAFYLDLVLTRLPDAKFSACQPNQPSQPAA
jgi:hypothetical protein